jgi:hypothetical protein
VSWESCLWCPFDICLHLFTSVYICLHLFTFVYICLHLFTFVYIYLHLFVPIIDISTGKVFLSITEVLIQSVNGNKSYKFIARGLVTERIFSLVNLVFCNKFRGRCSTKTKKIYYLFSYFKSQKGQKVMGPIAVINCSNDFLATQGIKVVLT